MTIVLAILCVGPFLDYHYHLSTFSRDVAPKTARIAEMVICTLLHLSTLILFLQGKFWARWISFATYLFWLGMTLLFVSSTSKQDSQALFELFSRFLIILFFLLSVKDFKQEKTTGTKAQ